MQQKSNVIYYFFFYLFILGIHFCYAASLIKRRTVPMGVGTVQDSRWILILLLVINGLSLSVFFFQDLNWILFNIFFHVVLALDEIVRMRKYWPRWVFMVNHCAWAGLLVGYKDLLVRISGS